jgi:hypothetical protein
MAVVLTIFIIRQDTDLPIGKNIDNVWSEQKHGQYNFSRSRYWPMSSGGT